jgi:hypothetical protein
MSNLEFFLEWLPDGTYKLTAKIAQSYHVSNISSIRGSAMMTSNTKFLESDTRLTVKRCD